MSLIENIAPRNVPSSEPILPLSNQPYFSASYVDDYMAAKYLLRAITDDKHIFQPLIKVKYVSSYIDIIKQLWFDDYIIHQIMDTQIYIIDPNTHEYIRMKICGKTIQFHVAGGTEFVDHNSNRIRAHFVEETGSYIKWWYSQRDYVDLPLDVSMLPVDSMYPFLGNETLHQYYDRFMKSTANVLLLMGIPGTGKSSFIRGLLDYTKTSAVVTYDPKLLEQDGLFVDFIEDVNCSCLVLEDSDNFLSARTDGNSMMHRFLNVSNGLVSTRNKKLIFSTNLPNIRDIDPALVRTGRCFDVLQFGKLTADQMSKLAADLNIEIVDSNISTIAELFHQNPIQPTQPTFGFNQ